MADKYHHGNSPAAWTGVVIAFIGFGAGSYFIIQAQPWGVVASGVILAIAALAGLVLRVMGYGQQQVEDGQHGHAAARAVEAEKTGRHSDALTEGRAATDEDVQEQAAAAR
ncbi:HGxxPAAW family protein [Streptomyces sp. RFCAC02]|uniref:HGxxPAAW family protein n=1 Tax=Streptomyces sp. RFCAC02 TaxID=2499143 RepID=UPI0019CF7320|nr:HGxxPAAW family protein [Streptomyces sp. RFCAC02]